MTHRLPRLATIAVAVLFACALLLTPPFPGIEKPGEAEVFVVRQP